MKKILFLLLGLSFLTACQTKKEVTVNTSENMVKSDKDDKVAQQFTRLEYEATTRGYYFKTTLENNILTVSKDRNNTQEPKKITISSSDASDINALLDKVALETLADLKAPSEKRFTDGAPFAKITIFKNGKSYESQDFDGGFPPKEIEKLVTKLISLSENK